MTEHEKQLKIKEMKQALANLESIRPDKEQLKPSKSDNKESVKPDLVFNNVREAFNHFVNQYEKNHKQDFNNMQTLINNISDNYQVLIKAPKPENQVLLKFQLKIANKIKKYAFSNSFVEIIFPERDNNALEEWLKTNRTYLNQLKIKYSVWKPATRANFFSLISMTVSATTTTTAINKKPKIKFSLSIQNSILLAYFSENPQEIIHICKPNLWNDFIIIRFDELFNIWKTKN